MARTPFTEWASLKLSHQGSTSKHGSDDQILLLYLSQRSPFTDETSLKNIATGVTAPPHVNVHESKYIRKHILASMKGSPVASYILQKKVQAVAMDTRSTIKIHDEYVHVDPQLLFQRQLTMGTKNCELQNVFDHELCHYPPALFESVNAIRPTTKSSMADALWCSDHLLHRVPWTR